MKTMTGPALDSWMRRIVGLWDFTPNLSKVTRQQRRRFQLKTGKRMRAELEQKRIAERRSAAPIARPTILHEEAA